MFSHLQTCPCCEMKAAALEELPQPLYQSLLPSVTAFQNKTKTQQYMPEPDRNLHTFCNSFQISHWSCCGREVSTLYEDMENCWTGEKYLAKPVCCDWLSAEMKVGFCGFPVDS